VVFFSNKLLKEETFVLPAKRTYVPEMKERIQKICREFNFTYKDLNNLMIVLDEACSNIIRHAYKDKPDGGDITFEVKVRQKGIYMTLIDTGNSFNWKNFKTPNLNHYVDIGKKGGLGVWIIRKLTDKSDYKVTKRGNELMLVKYHSSDNPLNWLLNTFTASKGIKERFVFSTTMFILLIVAGTMFYFVSHERISLRDKFIRYNAGIVQSISSSATERMIKGNYLQLIQLLKEIKANNENINQIFVINTDGRIVAHSDASQLYQVYSRDDKLVEERYNIGDVLVLKYKTEKGFRYDIAHSIMFRGVEMGEVHLYITDREMRGIETGKAVNVWMVWIAGFMILLVAMAGMYALLGLITKPLQRLREGALAIGEGRLDHRIELEGQDEFSQIANAFNEMASKFKGAQESIVEQEKMQKEIAVAKEIQQTLLPKDIPDTEGFDIASLYRSAKEVGGDYYDIIKIGPHLIGVIVADVSGKGVPGSLVMTITRTVARLVAVGNKSAKNMLSKVNNFVKEDMKKGMFVTAFYLVLNSFNRKINFASAGHDPLILFRAKEGRCYYIKPKGFPLGISLPDDSLFKKVMTEETVKLQKDDLLVVYTDGVTEAMNGKREQWGEQRFVEFIKANGKLTSREFIDEFDRQLKEFTQGYPQNDDITIVAIKEKRTEAEMIRKINRKVANLKKKNMTIKQIGKELGIDMEALKKMKKDGNPGAEEMKFLTFEHKKALMELIVEKPADKPSQYAHELSGKFNIEINEQLILNELKRVNLTKAERRAAYAAERKK
jgi:serine phosphatase RsbU (regulator of sigma subunit)/anti-sigma regulatory factor (Ser/Thr protein kinase)